MIENKADKYLKLVREGKSYREVGIIYDCTSTWIYLELKKNFTKAVIQSALKESKEQRKKKLKPFITITCRNCGKEEKTKYRYYKKTFCSLECQKEFLEKPWRTKGEAKENAGKIKSKKK